MLRDYRLRVGLSALASAAAAFLVTAWTISVAQRDALAAGGIDFAVTGLGIVWCFCADEKCWWRRAGYYFACALAAGVTSWAVVRWWP